MKIIKNNIRKYRLMTHDTQESLGRAIGITSIRCKQQMEHYEAQRRQPSAERRRDLEEYFALALGDRFDPSDLFIVG